MKNIIFTSIFLALIFIIGCNNYPKKESNTKQDANTTIQVDKDGIADKLEKDKQTLKNKFPPSTNIAMQGIKINAPKKVLEELKLELVAKEKNMVKYKTDNGNVLSITTANNKVVYLENDWLQDPKSKQPLYTNFTFGETNLNDIRNKFNTNGFTYKNRMGITTNTHVIEFNCFEFNSPNNEILVTITKASLKENLTEANVASKLKLDALIIADKNYLDKMWGQEKLFDTNYKKIGY